MIKKLQIILLSIFLLPLSYLVMAEETDPRNLVEMPPKMQQHFLANMRGHFVSLDAIIAALADEDFEKAADIADNQLGMHKRHQCEDAGHENHKGHQQEHDHKSIAKELGKELDSDKSQEHKGFGKVMPPEMKAMGMQLHHAASEFATVAKNGDTQESLKALQKVSSACVACHQAFRVR